MLPNDVDDELADVGEGKVVNAEQSAQVVEASGRLRLRIPDANETTSTVLRDLPRNEELIPFNLRIPIARSRGQPSLDFLVVHDRTLHRAYPAPPALSVVGNQPSAGWEIGL